jgi:hypothetical protein
MRIPKTVRIGGKVFTITYKSRLNDKDLHDGADLLGKADINACKIFLLRGLSKEKKKEIFLHEVLHIIDTDKGFNLNEKKVNNLAIEILDFIISNKINFLR